MNIHAQYLNETPDRAAAEAALVVLRQWAAQATDAEIALLDPSVARLVSTAEAPNCPALSREYPESFMADAAYA